jgi:hypoxia up-regulated 1
MLLLLVLVVLAQYTRAALLGIDLGSEHIKLVLLKHGVPLRIVEDETSKRKFYNLLAFDEDQRRFGNAAASVLGRKPDRAVVYPRDLLGKPLSQDLVQLRHNEALFPHMQLFNITHRNSIGVSIDAPQPFGGNYSAEDITAMMLQYCKHLAEVSAAADTGIHVPVQDAVIAVPLYFTQQQRQAVIDAAQLAGLSVLSMIHDNTAAALQYGIDRTFNDNATHTALFYNMGASSTQVTIAKYSGYTKFITKKTNKTVGQFEVVGTAYNEHLGGRHFDNKLTDLLAKRFVEQMAKKGLEVNPFENPRMMSRIRTAAKRLKEVLSANNEHPVYVESLWNENDLKTLVTREEFYELSSDLFAEVVQPVHDALKRADMTVENIDAFVLVGGGTRIPQIQTLLKNVNLGKDLNQNLNADEATAFGAALHGANLSTAFRVREFGIIDRLFYPIGVRIQSLNSSAQDPHFSKKASIFSTGSIYGPSSKRKFIPLHRKEDVSVSLFYEKDSSANPFPLSTPLGLAEFNITGFSRVLEYASSRNLTLTGEPKLSVAFDYGNSGIASVNQASCILEYEVVIYANLNDSTLDLNETTSEDLENNSTNVEAKKTKKKHFDLKVSRLPSYSVDAVKFLTSFDFSESAKKLVNLRAADDATKALAFALNKLESHIYSARDSFENDEELISVCSDELLENIKSALRDAEDWMYENNEADTPEKYERKLSDLKELSDPAFLRKKELTALPEAVSRAREVILKMKTSLAKELSWQNVTEISGSIEEYEQWLNSSLASQKDVARTENPVILSDEVYQKLDPIIRQFEIMRRKPKPKPKPSAKSLNETKTNQTDADQEMDPEKDEPLESETDSHENENTQDVPDNQDFPDDDSAADEKDEL